jgi:hypothetical protein
MKSAFDIAEEHLTEPAVTSSEGAIVAVLIDSTVLGAEIWLALHDDFKSDAGDLRAVYFAAELPFLRIKSPQTLREIHTVKLTWPSCRVIQEGAETTK